MKPKLLPEKGVLLGKNLIIADLHIGLEDYLNLDGHLIPIGLRRVVEQIKEMQRKYKAKRLIIAGDLKHSFSPFEREFRELRYFFDNLLPVFDEIVVVRGNHDTGIDWLTKLGVEVTDKYYLYDWTIVHGHKLEEGEKFIIGHQHPAIKLRDEVGAVIKTECFLKSKDLIVLPAFSIWSGGNDITQSIITPYLEGKVEEMEVVVPVEDELLNFGKLRDLEEYLIENA